MREGQCGLLQMVVPGTGEVPTEMRQSDRCAKADWCCMHAGGRRGMSHGIGLDLRHRYTVVSLCLERNGCSAGGDNNIILF